MWVHAYAFLATNIVLFPVHFDFFFQSLLYIAVRRELLHTTKIVYSSFVAVVH